MNRIAVFALLLFLFILSCNENKSIVGTTNTVGAVGKFYGVGLNRTVMLGWEFSAASIYRVGIYRHNTSALTYETAVRIGTVASTSAPTLSDTGLVNGTVYYYTIVPEQLQSDGSVVKSLDTKTIALTPADLSSIPADQLLFSQHIYPIFKTGCAHHGCHAGDGHNALKKGLHGGSSFSMASWSTMMEGTDETAQIVPYRASRSHLIQHINRDTLISPTASPSMPPAFPFPAELRDVIIRWINNGAKNDDGTVAYSSMPARGWAYVTNQGEDLTAVIDLDKNKIARYITTGVENTFTAPPQAPHNVVVDSNNQFYYVNLIGGSKVLKFRVADNVKTGEMSVGISSPAQIALSRNGDTAYVSNFENAKTNITVLNTASMTKIADVATPAMLKPHGVTITPDYRYVLVANSLSDNMTVISTADLSVVKTIPMSGSVPALPVGYAFQYEPYQSVVTPDSKFAYVTCRKTGDVRVIDLLQLKVIDSIKVGTFPLIPAITPDGIRIIVANRNSNSVSVITTSNRSVEYTLSNVGPEPHGVAVSKDGKFAYVSCENLNVVVPPHHAAHGSKIPSYLKVIDLGTRTVVASLELANFGSGLAVTH